MVMDDSGRMDGAILRTLAELSAATPAPPWQDAWKGLAPASSEEQRLAVYQAVRDADSLAPEAGFYLVASQIQHMTWGENEAVQALEQRVEALEQQHSVDENDDFFVPEDLPAEYREAVQRLAEAHEAAFAAKLVAYGEHEMARLYWSDRDEFERRLGFGQLFFDGVFARVVKSLDWLGDLLKAVKRCLQAERPLGPLALRYRQDRDCTWVVTMYLADQDHRGALPTPNVTIDLQRLRRKFDPLMPFGASVGGQDVQVEGGYRSRKVSLRLLSEPPRGDGLGLEYRPGKPHSQR